MGCAGTKVETTEDFCKVIRESSTTSRETNLEWDTKKNKKSKKGRHSVKQSKDCVGNGAAADNEKTSTASDANSSGGRQPSGKGAPKAKPGLNEDNELFVPIPEGSILHSKSTAPTSLPWQPVENLFTAENCETPRVAPVNSALTIIHVSAEGCQTTEVPAGASLEVCGHSWVHAMYKGKHAFIQGTAFKASTGLWPSAHNNEKGESDERPKREVKEQARPPKNSTEERQFRIRQWLDRMPQNPVGCTAQSRDEVHELTAATLDQNTQLLRGEILS
ncbi:hypothetical protein DIPPA_00549 [Diplonema papillatum]|nr:hypothetical protein DIPPA_00549 [Diplonema papillatum]